MNTNLSELRRGLRERAVPWLLWLGAIATAVVLYQDIGPGGPMVGFAETRELQVMPLERGQVMEVLTKPGASVRRGQTLALLDAAPLEAEIRILEAERQRAHAELARAQAEARRDTLTFNLAQSSETGRVDRSLEDARAALTSKRAALRAIGSELTQLEALVTQKLLEKRALTDLTIQRAVLRREAAEAKSKLDLLERQAKTAHLAGAADDVDGYITDATAPLQAALAVFDNQLLAARARREQLVLRAPIDGEVRAVLVHAGEIADPLGAVVTVVGENHGRVIACVPESRVDGVSVGDSAVIRTVNGSAADLAGRAIALGPVRELPQRCWRDPQRPLWGREAIIQLDGAHALLPGRAFQVQFQAETSGPPRSEVSDERRDGRAG